MSFRRGEKETRALSKKGSNETKCGPKPSPTYAGIQRRGSSDFKLATSARPAASSITLGCNGATEDGVSSKAVGDPSIRSSRGHNLHPIGAVTSNMTGKDIRIGGRNGHLKDRSREVKGLNDDLCAQMERLKVSSDLSTRSTECSRSHTEGWPPLDVRDTTSWSFYSRWDTSDLFLWRAGPADPTGVVLNLSDRPLLCMSVRGTEAAIGCSDHGVYTIDVATGRQLRNLYTKKFGHAEWVTCVDHLRDGRIISGALDNKLCLWDSTGVCCTDLTGHLAPISAVKVVDATYAISSSYDKTLMLWNLSRGQEGAVGCLKGHRGAVLAFAVDSHGRLVSGSRDGEVFLWDGRKGTAILHCKNAHQGHVTSVECLRDAPSGEGDNDVSSGCLGEVFLTGGQDGVLQVWDTRTKSRVHTGAISRSSKGKGAISNITVTSIQARSPPLLITSSADKVIRVLEPRSSFRCIYTLSENSDFIYSLYASGPLLWSGAGDGALLVYDLTNGKCLYGLGATCNGAVRCISLAGPRHLVVVGDDGNCMMYSL